MNKKLRQIVRKVLNAAANTPHFFDRSESERLNLLITDAYIRGQLSVARSKRDGKQYKTLGRRGGRMIRLLHRLAVICGKAGKL